MYSLSQKFAVRGAVCGLAMLALATPVSAAAITYTDFGTFQAAVPALTAESFDATAWLPAGTKPQGISHLGVTWTAANALFAFGGVSHSGANAITSLDGVNADIFDWIEAVLPANTMAVGGWITSFNQAHSTELLAYDPLDNLLGSVSLGNTGHAYAFLGLMTDAAIARVRFASTGVTNPIGDDFALDDFSFGGGNLSVPVSEPSGLVLFGAALAGLAFGRRRKPRAEQAALDDLDRRTLADIGIDPGAILAVAREFGADRLRRAPHD